jgi:hypothetical protein
MDIKFEIPVDKNYYHGANILLSSGGKVVVIPTARKELREGTISFEVNTVELIPALKCLGVK